MRRAKLLLRRAARSFGELATPAARLIARGRETRLRLDEVEALLASKTLIVDACRRAISLAARGSRSTRGGCSSRLRARWPKHGPAMRRAMRCLHAPFAPSMPIAATTALEMIGPMPGTVIRRWQLPSLVGQAFDLGRHRFDALIEATPVLLEVGEETQQMRRQHLGR
ncbi:MAG: hypothetical protein J2P50_02310 [Hyphomicrobiaceae bacterium]|nr:hypothetical protein [Hyphomicrobiaceae bacterium]